MAAKIPENMDLLYQGEIYIRGQSIAAIEADPLLLDHVVLIEATMNHIDFFAKRDAFDLDQETIRLLGARVFNDLAAGYGQLTRGYYQIAAATLRDIMEIVYLWGYFDREPAKIKSGGNPTTGPAGTFSRPSKCGNFWMTSMASRKASVVPPTKCSVSTPLTQHGRASLCSARPAAARWSWARFSTPAC